MTTDQDPGHREPADPTTAWPTLPPGTDLTVVKLAPDGREVTRYPGRVIGDGAPAPWLAVAARWVNRRIEMDGLVLAPGDALHEFFSPVHPFNAFAVFAPNGRLRGWYANVTYPATLDLGADPPVLAWHDLYLDLVLLPDGTRAVRDEDELEEAGLAVSDPATFAAILAARDRLLALADSRAAPFHDPEPPHP